MIEHPYTPLLWLSQHILSSRSPLVAVSFGTDSFKHSRHSFFDDPSLPIGAPRSLSLLLARMLTGEREIPTQDDLFSWKFSPAHFPHFTVNGQCLSVNSQLHHSPSTGQLASWKTPLIKQHKHTRSRAHTHTHLSLECPLCTSCWEIEEFFFTYESC